MANKEEEFFDLVDELRVQMTTSGVEKSLLDEATILWDVNAVNRINAAVAPTRVRPVPPDRVFILYDVHRANYLVLNNRQQYQMWYGG